MKKPILLLIRAFVLVHLAFVGALAMLDISLTQLLQIVQNLNDLDFLLFVGIIALGELTLLCLLITYRYGRTN